MSSSIHDLIVRSFNDQDGKNSQTTSSTPDSTFKRILKSSSEEEDGNEEIGLAAVGPAPVGTPPVSSEYQQDKSPGIDNEEIPPCFSAPSIPLGGTAIVQPSSTPSAEAVVLPSGIEALFEKMAAAMIILSSSRETETTLFLDSPQFASSLFYGTRITIKEFSTAPKAFNVEIASSFAAIAQLEVHKAGLLAAFQRGNFNFSIGRLETEIQQSDRPSFHRKESISQEGEGRDREPHQ